MSCKLHHKNAGSISGGLSTDHRNDCKTTNEWFLWHTHTQHSADMRLWSYTLNNAGLF